MGNASEDRAEAATLPEGDILRILLEQHAQIRELFDAVATSAGDVRKSHFDDLRTLIAMHETAEELILRPVTRRNGGDHTADARNMEEQQATEMLARLEKLDVDSPEFDELFRTFKKAVDDHAELEEHEEFPIIRRDVAEDMRKMLGTRAQMAEKVAPTHAHPNLAGSIPKQVAAGPAAAIIDRVKDALSRV